MLRPHTSIAPGLRSSIVCMLALVHCPSAPFVPIQSNRGGRQTVLPSPQLLYIPHIPSHAGMPNLNRPRPGMFCRTYTHPFHFPPVAPLTCRVSWFIVLVKPTCDRPASLVVTACPGCFTHFLIPQGLLDITVTSCPPVLNICLVPFCYRNTQTHSGLVGLIPHYISALS